MAEILICLWFLILGGLVLGSTERGYNVEASIVSHRAKRETACYNRLGCFSNDYPYNNTDSTLPADPDFIQTTFYVFTRRNPVNPGVILASHLPDIRYTNFAHNRTTAIIIHGFFQRADSEWVTNMTAALLRRADINVLVVDWGKGAGFPYDLAAANTRVVGAELDHLITYMANHGYVSPERLHLIGHSLGAHVAGYAGERLLNIGRITGLDPAEPSFQFKDPRVRLDPSDALFVDVIHTDGSHFNTVSGYGMSQAVGHMDFYPNGGVHQPGCSHVSAWYAVLSGMHNMDVDDITSRLGCSHSRAPALFQASIESDCHFYAYRCKDYLDFEDGLCFQCSQSPCPVMGYNSIHSPVYGRFYLKTQPVPDYCGYQYYLKIKTGRTMGYSSGVLSLRFLRPDGVPVDTDFSKERKTFARSREYKAVILTSADVREISRIQLQFINKSFFTWVSKKISVSRISITVGATGQTWHFCGHGEPVGKETVTLTTTSNESSDCGADNIQ